jgi:hypothetical protein
MKVLSKLVTPAALILLVLVSGTTLAQTSGDDPLAKRVAMVHTLLYDSSAAKQIMNNGSEPALAKRREAIRLYEAAEVGGDIEMRRSQLNQAVATMYEAVALVKNGAHGDEKAQRDFNNRKASLDALLAAHERIMDEKGKSQLHTLLLAEIEEDAMMAESLLAEGDVDAARFHLDKAYEVTMLSVEHAREGETLTRELKFDTPRDEYAYELDRNDTHRMLVTVLLKDKLENEATRNRVAGFLEAADRHRETALEHADAGRFEDAISALEQSTAELVKVIRGAGVYIPG